MCAPTESGIPIDNGWISTTLMGKGCGEYTGVMGAVTKREEKHSDSPDIHRI